MNEIDFISWLKDNLKQGEGVIVGPGDDCAVLDVADYSQITISTDTLLEGTHFSTKDEAYDIGWKTVAVNLSDMAAMGCRPLWAVTGLGFNRGSDSDWLKNFTKGLIACSENHALSLVGGDFTTSSNGTSITMTIVGIPFSSNPVYRSGAKVGDIIAVTGSLGGSIKNKHLNFNPRIKESEWLCKNSLPNAMMDISDGISLDLRRLCSESKVGAIIEEDKLPISEDAKAMAMTDKKSAINHALTDGEDFELLLTIDENKWNTIKSNWNLPTAITEIGKITNDCNTLSLRDINGKEAELPKGGYIHE